MKSVLKSILLSLFTVVNLYAQEENSSNGTNNLLIKGQFLGIEEGLSHRQVNSIVQDNRDIMWFATDYGINRFDGRDFKWFTNENSGLQQDEVVLLKKDPQGFIWIFYSDLNKSSLKHVDILNPETEKIISLQEFLPEGLPFKFSEVETMSLVETRDIIFATKSSLFYYADRFYETPISGADILELRGVERSPDGNFWLSFYMLFKGASYFMVYSPEGEKLDSLGFKNSNYIDIYEWDTLDQPHFYVYYHWPEEARPDQKYFLLDKEGKVKADTAAEKRFGELALKNNFIRRFFIKANGFYWVYDKREQMLAIPEDQQKEVINLKKVSKQIRNGSGIYEDRQGAVWISTAYGVHRFTGSDQRFKRHFDKANRSDTRSIRGIKVTGEGNKKKLWAMSEMPRTLFSEELARKRIKEEKSFSGGKWALSFNNDSSLVYMTDLGLKIQNPSKPKLDTTYPLNIPIAGGAWVIHQDKYGKYWFNNQFRSSLLTLSENGISEKENWHQTEVNPYVYQICENESDTAWIISSKGLYTVNLKTANILEHYWSGGKGKYFLESDNVQHLLPNSDGSYWLATAKSGLVKWSPKNGTLNTYNRLDGLPNNNVYAVYKDQQENLWLSTQYGIAQIDLNSGEIRTYTQKDGLANNEFNRISHHQDKEGIIYFGGLNGVTSFNPKDFNQDKEPYEPNLIFTNLEVFKAKEDTLYNQIFEVLEGEPLVILPGDYITEIAVSLLSYQEQEKIQYSYFLEGLSESWTYQVSNVIHLGKIPYGEYNLIVRGQEANGRWSNKELYLQIVVQSPLYLKPWFILVCFLALSLGLYLFSSFRRKAQIERRKELERQVLERTQTIEKQKEDLLSLDKMKSQFFANISHELRTPLTLISTPLNKLVSRAKTFDAQERRWLQYMQRNTNTLLGLVNEILDLAKMEEGKLGLETHTVALYQHFELLLEPFNTLAKDKDINFNWQINLDPRLLVKVDKFKLDRILGNLLSNAFKFSHSGGEVQVVIRADIANTVSVEVSDKGIGIKKEELDKVFDRFYQAKPLEDAEIVEANGGAGLGLALSKELAELIQGKLWVESEFQRGSTFFFKFPYQLVKAQAKISKKEPLSNDQEIGLKEVRSMNRQKPHILVVEDNPDLLLLLKEILEDKYSISTAENGAQAWSLLKDDLEFDHSNYFDLVLSDQMMPIMDGLSLLNKIKSDPALSLTPFIMLTARADNKLRMSALRIGVNDFLSKPFEEEELLLRIDNLLENYKARGEAVIEDLEEKNQSLPGFSKKKETDQKEVFEEENPSRKSKLSGKLLHLDKEAEEWLLKFDQYISGNLDNSDLKVSDLAFHFAMSESTLLRQVKKLTGLSPQKYLQEARLQRALSLIEEKDFTNLSSLIQKVGFKELASFSRSFKARFGKPPSSFTN